MRGVALLVVMSLLAGCAAPTDVRLASVQTPAEWLAPNTNGPAPRSDWWSGLGDPVLSALVERALVNNIDVRQSISRLEEASAMADAQRGLEQPSLALGAEGGRSRTISDVFLLPFIQTSHQSALQASYEVDLWGKDRSLTASAEAMRTVSAATRDSVVLSVAASVAAGYVNLRSLDAQLDLAHRTLDSREKSAALTRSREARGYSSALESAQAESELRATAQVIPQLEQAIQRQERALNLLLGTTPTPVSRGNAIADFSPLIVPSAGLPSELLRRRPDIVAAEYQVVAADKQFAAARAQLLPTVQIAASFGRAGSSVLTGDPFTVWSVGGSVLAPIFNGGRLRALARASASKRDQALIAYERAVLTSFSEVENELNALARQREQLSQANAQQVAAERAVYISTRRYEEGYSSYLDQLVSQRTLFSVEQSVIQLRAQLIGTEVSLLRALGGGWHATSEAIGDKDNR